MTRRARKLWMIAGVFGLLALAFLAFTQPALAQTTTADLGLDAQFDTGLSAADPRIIIANIIRVLLGFLGIAAVSLMIYAGVIWMTAGGREEAVSKAQRIMVNALIGLVIILSAFAITQFVLNTLLDATGANSVVGSEFTPGGGGPPGGPTFGSGFTLDSVTPSGSVPIRNVVVQVAFSSNVDSSTVADNVVVRPVGSTTPVDGAFNTTGPVIRFTPSAACPTPNESLNCFEADTAYEVLVASGLKGTNGAFVNCGFGGCTETFITGNLVDVTPPAIVIVYPEEGDSVSTSPDLPISYEVVDDVGIGLVEGFVDSETIGTDAPPSLLTSYTAVVNWSATGLVPQQTYRLNGEVTDLAGFSVISSSIGVIARPDHCFDGVQNFGETGLDCGGDPASADYCGACSGDACTTDADCSTGSCVDGICVELPRITGVSPTSGAPGNFVTITGDALGSSEGVVRFLGDPETDADDLVAGLACSAWSADEVIVAVPNTSGPFPIGPISLTTSGGQVDRTDNTNGPALPDFEINSTVRPGLCAVTPGNGESGDGVTLTGVNLGSGGPGTEVYMDTVLVTSVSDWSATGFDAIVPPITSGEKSLVVRVGAEDSNPLSFTVDEPDAGSAPAISYITPESGPAGEYLTLFGSNFGTSGNVYFVDPATGNEAVGDVSFPDVCTVDNWSTTAVTVKVPSEYLTPSGAPINIGAHNVRIERSPVLVSEEVGFEITSGVPGPGICGMTPVSGPTGLSVDIFGENFGPSPDTVTFFNGQSAAITSWDTEEISVEVPAAAATGAVTVTVGADSSNEANFEVGACDPTNDTCGTGTRCCANTLACTPLAVDCEIAVPDTNYLFEWVTGPIPVVPRVIRQCDDPVAINRIVSPSPWSGRTGGDQVCVNAKIAAAFTVPVTNITDSTVLVQECVGPDPAAPCSDVSPGVVPGNFNVLTDRFEFTPTVALNPDTTYQVTLTTDILAAGPSGEALAAPFVWDFTTRNDAAPCEVQSLLVSPGLVTLTEEGDGLVSNETDAGDVLLSASGIGGDVCVLLELTDTVNWSASNNVGIPTSPSVTLLPAPSGEDDERVVRADNETDNGPLSVLATLVTQGVSGLSLVNVDFTDPEVQNYWPNCGSACVNAQIGVQFNTEMDPASIGPSQVTLQECQTELCQQFISTIPVTTPAMTEDNTVQVIVPTVTLSSSSFYRVVIDGSVASASGVPLTALNYGGGFSWTFRVSPDGALCSIDHVETSPATATLRAIGERQQFSVTPFGPPDDCSEGGQRLNAADYDWTWTSSNTTTAYLLGSPAGGMDLGPAPGCTANCVFSGSQSGIAVCGDGVRSTVFEECDDGNTTPGDGCSATCLWEGLPTCADPSDPFCCGNGTQDAFEECDDGNGLDGDGCSALCLNEGADAVGSQCGNGAIAYLSSAGGEDCDDGNNANGDGCSAQCLYEGSNSSNPAVCGNGLLERSGGEECDDGNELDGDGCSSSCLVQPFACTPSTTTSCCGNNTVDPSNGEQCDGGEGCTDECRYAGSSYTYSTPSFCGDGVRGSGENALCEGVGGDGRVDGIQVAEVSVNIASQSVPSNGIYSTDIEATEVVSSEDDIGVLNVQCTCESSAECPTGGAAFACGEATGCCAPRPSLPTFFPVGAGACRNTEVRVIFDDFMDAASFTDSDTSEPNVALRIPGVNDETTCSTFDGYTYIAIAPVDVPFLPGFVNRFLTQASAFLRAPEARAIAQGCYLPASLIPVEESDHTEVVLQYSVALEPSQQYEIVVVGDATPTDASEDGVLTVAGAGLNVSSGEVIGTFTTGTEICELDQLTVGDSTGNGLFLVANDQHTYEASALTQNGSDLVPITPIPGVYDWTIAWSLPPASPVLAVAGDGEGLTEEIQSGQESGVEDVAAVAEITSDTLNDPTTVGNTITGSLRSRVFICEVPWPGFSTSGAVQAPLSDTEGNDDSLLERTGWSNFSTLYCRAEVAPSVASLVPVANAQTGVLPEFQVIQPAAPPPGVEKEFILRHPTSPEAIGIRVISNTSLDDNGDGDLDDANDVQGYLRADQWYAAQGFTGSPVPATVDGYRAVQDGRTVYVGALNSTSGGDLEPTIYAISYSEGASPETIDIYNQIVQNFQFLAGEESPYIVDNPQICLDDAGDPAPADGGGLISCTSDIDCIEAEGDVDYTCDAPRDKARRDLARIEDMRLIEQAVTSYGETNRHCSVTTNLVCLTDDNCPGTETCNADVPLLDAGSFIRGWATSAWPSWNTELGNELGTALPTDPLNDFVSIQDCLASNGYDTESCWNGNTSLFQCPASSHVYRYQRSGIESYTLAVDLETAADSDGNLQWSSEPLPLLPNATLTFGNFDEATAPAVAAVCDGGTYGAGGVCGDGVIGELSPGVPEVCEIGNTSTEPCTFDFDGNGTIDADENGVRTTTCNTSCSAYTNDSDGDGTPDSVCIQQNCGNGVVETGETCDDGELNGLYGFCSTQCDYDPSLTLLCGNSAVEGPEICDDGSNNGQYSLAGSICAWDCSGPGPRCGDGIINGGEQCDGLPELWAGALCDDAGQAACTTDADCDTGVTCGDGDLTNDGNQLTYDTSVDACPLIGFCVGGSNADAECDPATGALIGTGGNCSTGGGVCTQFATSRTRTCSTSACSWNTWSGCVQQGSCGDGILDAGEQCDDGNSSNTDGCTNICQFNVCGDGFLNPALESCDLGPANGTACTANYGGVCNYCTTACSYQTVSGGFCGDGVVQPEGGEICDGNAPMYYYDYDSSTNTVYQGSVCYLQGEIDPLNSSATCQVLGACNGGDFNGETCSTSVLVSNGCLEVNDGGVCEPSECELSCSNACPFNYESIFALAQPWHSFTNAALPGEGFSDSIELFSYETNGTCNNVAEPTYNGEPCQVDAHCNTGSATVGVCEFLNSPDFAQVQFPECRVGSHLLADVDYDFTYPELDVVFIIDQSSSMSRTALGPGTRWSVMIDALEGAVDTLFDDYPGVLRTGVVTFGGRGLDDAQPASAYDFEYSTTSCTNEPLWDATAGAFDWPENWEDIQANAVLNQETHTNSAACIHSMPSTDEGAVLGAIGNILTPPVPSGSGYSTPTAAGLARAHEVLTQYPVTHKRIAILLSDGKPTCNGSSNYSSDCLPVVEEVYNQASNLKNEGIDLYSAYFNDDLTGDTPLRLIRAFEVYSSDCPAYDGTGTLLNPGNLTVSTEAPYNYSGTDGLRWYGRYDSCGGDQAFSYIGDEVSSFDDMFQAIIDNILNARVFVGNDPAATSSTLVTEGPQIEIALPEDFSCPVATICSDTGLSCTTDDDCNPSATCDPNVAVKIQFPGEGTVTIENFQFLYCSE